MAMVLPDDAIDTHRHRPVRVVAADRVRHGRAVCITLTTSALGVSSRRTEPSASAMARACFLCLPTSHWR